MKILKDLLYTKDHEWVKVQGNEAYIGITDYAQHALGDIVFVDLPEIGQEFEAGDNFSAVESVKAASDIYIPISGKILNINEALSDDPALINQDPYENWLVLIEIKDESQLNDLMNSEEYEIHCKKED
ncbi:glycine cleavage system protein GcvH [Sporanaerobacter sp. PP17-6a]|jgi:glycine cleavage system H protein|uniref:glycine cleavage system protein GcvH n=1 Tax=Sporanaerobacter sp. PP17-6a TaxID=1891289 RepID=UPI0008A02140|nr:glycine cleavage system protein GcvH [Sporanaerobacter sp. PP17-6a]SCL86719.1 Octanoyl/lipoyl carrier protein [Sporanaerobacter sp. PP17-6a]